MSHILSMTKNSQEQGEEANSNPEYGYYIIEEGQFDPAALVEEDFDEDYELELEALQEEALLEMSKTKGPNYLPSEDEEETKSSKIQLRARRPTKKHPACYTCLHCDKSFTVKRSYEEHLRVHTGERPFQCPQCPARFAQRANWSTHIRHTHAKETGHKCTECERSFSRRRLLDQHVKTVHQQLRDLQCQLCEATFSHPVNYKKHMLSHSGVKAYECEICSKKFGRAENRDIHRFLHSNSKPYVCTVCKAGYMRKQQLMHHIQVTQHVNEKIVRQKPEFSAAVEQQKKNKIKAAESATSA